MHARLSLAFAASLLVFSCSQGTDTPQSGAPQTPPPVGTLNASDVPKTLSETRPSAATRTALAPQSRRVSEQANILVLGDSQISFGAGGAYTAFFENLTQNCGAVVSGFGRADAAAIGVRSTALHHWTARGADARRTICDVDPTYGVNAGSYGITSAGRSYVQIGADPDYPFCPTNRSPLEAVFDAPAFDPDLVVLAFLGNATDRWQSATTARTDWQAVTAQLPAGMPCIVMTTIPTFEGGENDRRMRAQSNLGAAVEDVGNCAFVPGVTEVTRTAIEGNASFFRTDAAGVVTDPRHPTAASAARFVDLQTPAFCAAVNRVVQK